MNLTFWTSKAIISSPVKRGLSAAFGPLCCSVWKCNAVAMGMAPSLFPGLNFNFILPAWDDFNACYNYNTHVRYINRHLGCVIPIIMATNGYPGYPHAQLKVTNAYPILQKQLKIGSPFCLIIQMDTNGSWSTYSHSLFCKQKMFGPWHTATVKNSKLRFQNIESPELFWISNCWWVASTISVEWWMASTSSQFLHTSGTTDQMLWHYIFYPDVRYSHGLLVDSVTPIQLWFSKTQGVRLWKRVRRQTSVVLARSAVLAVAKLKRKEMGFTVSPSFPKHNQVILPRKEQPRQHL